MERILDAHCHIYPDKIADKAVKGVEAFYDLPLELKGTVSDLLDVGNRYGITNFLVNSVSTTPHQVKSINEFIAAQVAAYPDRLTGFGTLHPDSETPEEDLEHLLELGLKGVKLHPDFQKFSMESEKSVRLCRMFAGKLPLLLHTGDYRYEFSNPDNLLRFLDKVPDATVIGAHFGGWSVLDEAVEKLAGIPNLYVDCSSSFYYMDKEKAVKVIESFGVEKVLFGSDYPMWNPGREMEFLRSLGLSAEDERKILWDNGCRLLGL